jgi:putative ATPase
MREAQLAALVEGISDSIVERLSLSPTDDRTEQWLQRTIGQAGERFAAMRDRIFQATQLQRHHLVLDLNARSGLLTWEALRQVPEGGVYACVDSAQDAAALSEQAQVLPELLRPVILQASARTFTQYLPEDLRFDYILGRNILMAASDKAAIVNALWPWLQPQGTIILLEAFPQQAQRLYNLLPDQALKAHLFKKLKQAEEAIYQDDTDPKVNWDLHDLEQAFQTAHLQVEFDVETTESAVLITPGMLDRWLDPTQPHSYIQRLAVHLTKSEQQGIVQAFRRTLTNQTVNWRQVLICLNARLAPSLED